VAADNPPHVMGPLDPGAIPPVEALAAQPTDRVLELLGTTAAGLDSVEAAARAATFGPNAVRSHHTSASSVLLRQVSSPLLWLLLGAATVSVFVGEGTDALIIGVIIVASVGLGFANEYRAERAAEAMRDPPSRHRRSRWRADECRGHPPRAR
jgi:Mg2+-importing ATPase